MGRATLSCNTENVNDLLLQSCMAWMDEFKRVQMILLGRVFAKTVVSNTTTLKRHPLKINRRREAGGTECLS